MTINYICDLATDVGPDEIASRLQDLIGGRVHAEGKFLRVGARPVGALIMTEANPVIRGWFLADWGIDSKIRISFTLNESVPDEEFLAGRRDFSIASVRLGEDLDTDALFLYEGDRPMMRRQNGALTLYDWWPDWTHPEVIARLPPNYTLTSDGLDTPVSSYAPSSRAHQAAPLRRIGGPEQCRGS